MSESELRNAFRELAGGVKPGPEPYARLMARSRRRRFSRWVTGFTAAVAAAVLAPVALNAANDPGPDLGQVDNSVLPITPWTRKLIDAPVRGSLAADRALVDEAGKGLRALNRGPMAGYPTKVLFIEDVGDRRIVVGVRHSKTHQVGVVVAAPRGARGEQLAATPQIDAYLKSLNPFTGVEFGFGLAQNLTHIGVGLAPPGCEVALATRDSGPAQWRVSGDYVVWSESVADQLARVRCEGKTRFQGALLDLNNMMQVTGTGDLERFRTAATAESGFVVPGAILDDMLNNTYPPQAVGQLRVMFAGVASGMANPVYVAADPVDKGRWRLQVVAGSVTAQLLTTVDVLAADAVVAVEIPNHEPVDTLLVMAPRNAVKVEIRDASSGTLIKSVALGNGSGLVQLRAVEDMQLRAFDATGALVGNGVLPLPEPDVPSERSMPETSENWG